ncbi:MAG: hypothetical protein WBQ18_17595, partial [Solirubrobacteraceae bacterium]
GQLVTAHPGAHLVNWQTQNPFPGGLIEWNVPIPPSCAPLATANLQSDTISYASAQLASGGTRQNAGTYVRISAPSTGVSIAIICPQP